MCIRDSHNVCKRNKCFVLIIEDAPVEVLAILAAKRRVVVPLVPMPAHENVHGLRTTVHPCHCAVVDPLHVLDVSPGTVHLGPVGGDKTAVTIPYGPVSYTHLTLPT